jgi:hypothetical protein
MPAGHTSLLRSSSVALQLRDASGARPVLLLAADVLAANFAIAPRGRDARHGRSGRGPNDGVVRSARSTADGLPSFVGAPFVDAAFLRAAFLDAALFGQTILRTTIFRTAFLRPSFLGAPFVDAALLRRGRFVRT